MVYFALIFAACGAILGSWLRVFVLLPASFLVWILAFVFACTQGFSLLIGFGLAMLFAACLQLGYLLGATFVGVTGALRKRRRIMAVH